MSSVRARIGLLVFTFVFLAFILPSKVSPSLGVKTKCGVSMRDSIFIDSVGIPERLADIIRSIEPSVGRSSALDIARAIHSSSISYRIDPALIIAVMRVESNFEDSVVSYAGAVGLMQVLPGTGQYILEKEGLSFRKHYLTKKDLNVRMGVSYLRYLLNKYDGDVHLALTAYNMGPGNLNRLISRGLYKGNSLYSRKVMSRFFWIKEKNESFLSDYLCELGTP